MCYKNFGVKQEKKKHYHLDLIVIREQWNKEIKVP